MGVARYPETSLVLSHFHTLVRACRESVCHLSRDPCCDNLIKQIAPSTKAPRADGCSNVLQEFGKEARGRSVSPRKLSSPREHVGDTWMLGFRGCHA